MELPKNLAPDQASPNWLSKGDNAWQLTAATLVGMQSMPGLVILYGSIVKKKWAVNLIGIHGPVRFRGSLVLLGRLGLPNVVWGRALQVSRPTQCDHGPRLHS